MDNVSKYMSYLLRHGASKENLYIDSGGYIYINDFHKHILYTYPNVRINDIYDIVKKCPKQRFEIGYYEGYEYIRATQGHTIQHIDDLELCKPILNSDQLPEYIVHGTMYTNIPLILKNGLCRMNRKHIHMTRTTPESGTIISGMRKSCDTLVLINVKEAMNAGIKFMESSNGVILSPGLEPNGIIPSNLLKIRKR